MLDLSRVARQLDAAARALVERQATSAAAVERLGELARLPADEWADLLPHLRAQPHNCLVAFSDQPAATRLAIAPAPERHSVVATDGSQVAPDRHDGIEGVGLIHLGLVSIHYGTGARARLEASAELFFEEDEDGAGAEGGALALRRFGRELDALSCLAATTAEAVAHPTVALTDGSLIAWALASDEADLPSKREAREALQAALERCRAAAVPPVGYVSAPASRDVANGLRAALRLRGEEEPAGATTDAALFGALLSPGERSPFFGTEGLTTGFPHVLRDYAPEQRIAFCYAHTGAEIARIELPAWAVRDECLRERALAVCLDQARKGRGYPVALAEAHERAVVHGSDRRAFLDALTRALVRAGGQPRPSLKAHAKRLRAL